MKCNKKQSGNKIISRKRKAFDKVNPLDANSIENLDDSEDMKSIISDFAVLLL